MSGWYYRLGDKWVGPHSHSSEAEVGLDMAKDGNAGSHKCESTIGLAPIPEDLIERFDHASDLLNDRQRPSSEFKLLLEHVPKIMQSLLQRMTVAENTTATRDWKRVAQAELRRHLKLALSCLDQIEEGKYNNHTL